MSSVVRIGRALPFAALIAIAVVCGALVPQRAHAAKMYSGGRGLTVAEGDTIHDDVYVTGGEMMVRGVVDGDVVAAGGQVTLNGNVTGSVLAAGGQLDIRGNIGGSVRVAGGKVTVGADIGHDLVAAGGQIDVMDNAHVGRDLIVAGGRTLVDGRIERNAHIGTGRLTFGRSAVIGGDLEYASDHDAVRMPGSTVTGKTTWYASNWHQHRTTMMERFVMRLIGSVRYTVGLLMVGLLFILIFPPGAQRSLERLATQPLPSLGIGLLTAVGLPVIGGGILLCGLLIGGWWIGAYLIALTLFAMAVGTAVAAMTLGRWMGATMGARGIALGWALALGAFALLIVRMIPVLGGMLLGLVMLAGLGALAMTVGAAIQAGRAKATVAGA